LALFLQDRHPPLFAIIPLSAGINVDSARRQIGFVLHASLAAIASL
jgi:hypothetical protein